MYSPEHNHRYRLLPLPKKKKACSKIQGFATESPPERGDTIDTLALNDDFTEVDVVYLNKKKFEITH